MHDAAIIIIVIIVVYTLVNNITQVSLYLHLNFYVVFYVEDESSTGSTGEYLATTRKLGQCGNFVCFYNTRLKDGHEPLGEVNKLQHIEGQI